MALTPSHSIAQLEAAEALEVRSEGSPAAMSPRLPHRSTVRSVPRFASMISVQPPPWLVMSQ